MIVLFVLVFFIGLVIAALIANYGLKQRPNVPFYNELELTQYPDYFFDELEREAELQQKDLEFPFLLHGEKVTVFYNKALKTLIFPVRHYADRRFYVTRESASHFFSSPGK